MVLHFRRRQLPSGLGRWQILARSAAPDHHPILLRTIAPRAGWIVRGRGRRRSAGLPTISGPPERSCSRSATEATVGSFLVEELPRGLPFGRVENSIAILIELLYQLDFLSHWTA